MNSTANTPFPNAPPTTPYQPQQVPTIAKPPATISAPYSLNAPKPRINPFTKKPIGGGTAISQPISQVATPVNLSSLSNTPNPTTTSHTFFPSPSPIIPSRPSPNTNIQQQQSLQPPVSLQGKTKKHFPPPPIPFIPSVNTIHQTISPSNRVINNQTQEDHFPAPTLPPSQIVQPTIEQPLSTTPKEVNPASFYPNATKKSNAKADSKPFHKKPIPPPIFNNKGPKNQIPIPSLNYPQRQSSTSTSSTSTLPHETRRITPIIKFGYRGQLLVMKPNNNKNGAIVINHLCDSLRDNKSIVCEKYFPGPLNENTKLEDLLFYIEKEESLCSVTSSWKILWLSLKYLLENKGEIDLLSHPPVELLNYLKPSENTVIERKYNIKVVPVEEQEKALNEIEFLLLHGKLSEAIDLAISKELWSHALIISSSGGSKGFGNIVQRFNNHIFPKESLLPSFYTHFSDSLSSNSNSRISNWKHLLYSFLSTNSVSYDKNMKELGDSLLLNGDFAAAHSCYIVYIIIILLIGFKISI